MYYLPESHTGENLATELEGMLATWKLSAAQLSAAKTDKAADMMLAIGLLGWGHFCCFSHSLQLAINKALAIQQISNALARARNLFTHCHHSARSSHLLTKMQKGLKHPSHSLVRQVATRWNSAYYMLQRILEQLRQPDVMPTDVGITAMELFVEVTETCVQVTEIMGAATWVTSSFAHPLLYKLLCHHLPESSSDS